MSLFQEIRASLIAESYRLWVPEGGKALDVGCGNAVVSQSLAKALRLDLCGTDIVDYRCREIPFKLMDNPGKIPFAAASFDYAFFNDVLHHAQYIPELLSEAGRVAANILVFEDRETAFLKIFDRAFNHFYCSKIPAAARFKSEGEWGRLFSRLGFQYEIGVLSYPRYYPLRHICFKLKNGKSG